MNVVEEQRAKEQEFKKRLLEVGLLTKITPPIIDFSPWRDRRPVPIEGKPVSELIIEERR